MLRVFADLGNSRLKWGRTVGDGRLDALALPVDDPRAWSRAWSLWNPDEAPSTWWVSTVNPAAADRLDAFLAARPGVTARWFRSAADVPIRHELDNPHTAGTDRAFAVLGALAGRGRGPDRAGIVISCGSAITVDRVSERGVWQGGAIAAGFTLAAGALHALSTQLPLVHPDKPPDGWGRSTIPALEAGVFWGTVGAIRALVDRQTAGLIPRPWVVWSGGDSPLLSASAGLDLTEPRVVPALVLEGLRAASGA